MPINLNFRAAVLKYGEMYIEELTKQLLLNDKKASGDLIDSLDYRVVDALNGVTLEILANPYLKWIDKGRKPNGTLPPPSMIQQWISSKGITPTSNNGKVITTQQLSWAIGKSIQMNGIPASNVLRKAKFSLLVNKQAINSVVNGAQVDIKLLIKEALKNLNSN